MTNTLPPGHYLGSKHAERQGAEFTIALRRATVPPEQVLEHHHEGAHLVLAIDEGYLTAAQGERAAAGPLALVYNPAGTVHRDRFATTSGRFMSIDIDPALAPAGGNEPLLVRDCSARAAAARVAGLVGNGDADALELEDLVLASLAAIGAGAEPRAIPTWLATAAEALADLAIDGTTKVSEIARMVGVHPVHLARMHRRHFGCGPGDALRRHRAARAAGLLARGSELADVAFAAGFADQSHMTRTFRREFGTTPARYRNAFG